MVKAAAVNKGKGNPKTKKQKEVKTKTENNEQARLERAAKRREKRQSKAKASKRHDRQNRRKIEGGTATGKQTKKELKKLKKAQKQAAAAPKAADGQKAEKSAFHKAAIDYQNSKSSKTTDPELATFLSVVHQISPAGYFPEQPPPGPPGQFLSVYDSLEIQSKVEKKIKIKKISKDAAEDLTAPEDKPSGAAIERARKLLEERKKTLPLFDKLRETSSAKRAEGAKSLVEIASTGINQDSLNIGNDDVTKPAKYEKAIGSVPSYIISRLIKGLTSGVGGSRLGFCETLIRLLNNSKLPTSYITSSLDALMKSSGPSRSEETQGSEQRQLCWGVFFGLLAILCSKRELNRVTLSVTISKLLQTSAMLPASREACSQMVLLLVKRFSSETSFLDKAIMPSIFEHYFHSAKFETWSPESLFMFLELAQMDIFTRCKVPETHIRLKELVIGNVSVSNSIAETLFQGDKPIVEMYPKVHSVWGSWFKELDSNKTGGKSFEQRLRAFWNAIVVPNFTEESLEKRPYKHLYDYLIAAVVKSITTNSDGKGMSGLLLAELSEKHPQVTTQLLKQGKPAVSKDTVVDAAKVTNLMQQLHDLRDQKLRKQFPEIEEAANHSDSDSEQSSDSENENDEEMEEVEDDEPVRDGYLRFSFNIQKYVFSELRALTTAVTTPASISASAVALEKVISFLVTHSFFATPAGTADTTDENTPLHERLLSVESLPPVLRTVASDQLFTIVRHISATMSITKDADTSVAKSLLISSLKRYEAALTDVTAEAMYQSPDSEEGVAVTSLLKDISKCLLSKKGTKKVAGRPIDKRHLIHFEALLTLIYFNLVIEGSTEAGATAMLTLTESVHDICNSYASGSFTPEVLLDSLLSVNLRYQETLPHLSATINKISTTIIELVISNYINDECLEILLAPLSPEGFEVQDDDDDDDDDTDSKSSSASESDSDDGEEAAVVSKPQTKADRQALEHQLRHAQVRALQYLLAYLKRCEGSKATSLSIGAIAEPVTRLAELSLPKLKASNKNKRKQQGKGWNEGDQSNLQNTAPVLSASVSVLNTLAKAKTSKPDTDRLLSALDFCVTLATKDNKAKLQEREGKHLKNVTLKVAGNIISILYSVKDNSIEKKVFALTAKIFATKKPSAAFMKECISGLFERSAEAVYWAIVPALTTQLKEQTQRPFNRAIILEVSHYVTNKWGIMDSLVKTSKTLIPSLVSLATSFDIAKEGLAADDASCWRARVLLPAGLLLQTTVIRFLERSKKQDSALHDTVSKSVDTYIKKTSFIDLNTKAALRKAWQYLKVTSTRDDVQSKPRKPATMTAATNDEVADPMKQKRKAESEKAANEAEQQAKQQKLDSKKAMKEQAKKEREKAKRKKSESKKNKRSKAE
eukprot:TRINITY_DN8709_c0_g1_i1.p1 TRINITY_DN8709_c0_g1~~TRINITY_DN8709_c0_g1_i1.p1  ORF type:complete len:1384 (+),score=410.74 TRINITY_DN8709_c0_g1_i1:51-4202(+)